MEIGAHLATFEYEGLRFRDLDHDGVLAPFEDWRRSPEERARDLVGHLHLDEKVGLLLHGTLTASGPFGVVGLGDHYALDEIADLVQRRHISSAISRMALPPSDLARAHNDIQLLAASTRCSIPVSISSDPRHHFTALRGSSVVAQGFTKFPEFLGLGATNDAELVRAMGDVVRREYRAVGLHVALSPQADLATEPRWSRALGTFGSDPTRVAALTEAYIEGAQGSRIGVQPTGVACVVKHWVGYGASRDGFDGHNYYGRFSAFPAGRFADHVAAFAGAFSVNVAGVMPTYNILEGVQVDGLPVEPVGAGFSRVLLTTLLRETHRFRGMVLSDWSITRDATEACRTGVPAQGPADIAMPWGVEHLSRRERFAATINAGVDQIGGEDDPLPLLDAINDGLITIDRVDEAAYRVLTQKFQLGLFENPFVDPEVAGDILGNPAHVALSEVAQRRSLVVFKEPSRQIRPHDRVYLYGISNEAAASAGLSVAETVGEATIAVARISAPFESLHPNFFFGSMMHEGSLDYAVDDPRIKELREIAERVPLVTTVFCDRPPTVGVLDDISDGLVANYGVTDDVLIDVLHDESPVTGLSPMARPTSMAEVLAHPCDQYDGWELT